jgi:hypothetical protein
MPPVYSDGTTVCALLLACVYWLTVISRWAVQILELLVYATANTSNHHD